MSGRNAYFDVCRDPWDAPPAGLPDLYESHSVPLKLKASFLINSQADGTFVVAFHPLLSGTTGFSAVGSSTAGSITAVAGANHPDITSITAQFNSWRPISVGVKCFYLGAEGTSSGVISCGHNDNFQFTTAGIGNNFPTAISDWSDLPNSSSSAVAALTEPMAVAARAFDRAGFNAVVNTIISLAFPTCWVTGTNLPASIPVCRIEVALNIEAIPFYGNQLTAHLQTQTPPNEAAIASVHRRLGVVRTGTLSKVMSMVGGPTKRKTTRRRKPRKRTYKRARATVLMQPVKGSRGVKRSMPYQGHREGIAVKRTIRY